MKFLIIRLSSLGDIVMTTKLVRCLKKQIAGADIHYLTDDAYTSLLSGNPHITAVHSVHHLTYGLVDELKKEQFDQIIDLQHDETSELIGQELGVPALVFHDKVIRKSIYTKFKINTLPGDEHQVDRFMKLVASLGVHNDGSGLDYFIPSEEAVTEKDIPASHHLGFIAIIIGSSWFTKKMPVEKWQEVCKKTDHPIILIGGKNNFHEGERISAVDPVKVYNACGKFSLNESADLIRRSKLVVSHDTGFMQVAAAFKKPVITVWGSTVPALGEYPYYGHATLPDQEVKYDNIQKSLWCRPCTTTGRDHCPLGHFHCMKKIEESEIVEKIREGLRRG